MSWNRICMLLGVLPSEGLRVSKRLFCCFYSIFFLTQKVKTQNGIEAWTNLKSGGSCICKIYIRMPHHLEDFQISYQDWSSCVVSQPVVVPFLLKVHVQMIVHCLSTWNKSFRRVKDIEHFLLNELIPSMNMDSVTLVGTAAKMGSNWGTQCNSTWFLKTNDTN